MFSVDMVIMKKTFFTWIDTHCKNSSGMLVFNSCSGGTVTIPTVQLHREQIHVQFAIIVAAGVATTISTGSKIHTSSMMHD